MIINEQCVNRQGKLKCEQGSDAEEWWEESCEDDCSRRENPKREVWPKGTGSIGTYLLSMCTTSRAHTSQKLEVRIKSRVWKRSWLFLGHVSYWSTTSGHRYLGQKKSNSWDGEDEQLKSHKEIQDFPWYKGFSVPPANEDLSEVFLKKVNTVLTIYKGLSKWLIKFSKDYQDFLDDSSIFLWIWSRLFWRVIKFLFFYYYYIFHFLFFPSLKIVLRLWTKLEDFVVDFPTSSKRRTVSAIRLFPFSPHDNNGLWSFSSCSSLNSVIESWLFIESMDYLMMRSCTPALA